MANLAVHVDEFTEFAAVHDPEIRSALSSISEEEFADAEHAFELESVRSDLYSFSPSCLLVSCPSCHLSFYLDPQTKIAISLETWIGKTFHHHSPS